ncbi:hypothetical protein O6H91_20G048600 [Diphasiastrum complanatum]|uniref:Uncharacterized protein n=1 Tax=Diphasiastrum complanatum TaxID=34168 RepID=A0ACC2AQ70_DIPCM|nr:hypothetical protein O6H91_20G048600 [Diphasiastrum complanatum]
MNNASTNQACSACKFQRRRCSADCPLIRYFPAEQNQRFVNCKRLFGVSNMIRFLKDADPADKDDTMKSLIYEADARERDPVHGCLGIVNRLKEKVAKLGEELHAARGQLYILEQQHATCTLYQQHLAQCLTPACVPGPPQLPPHMMPFQYVHPNVPFNLDAGLEYELRPIVYEQRQDFVNLSRQTYEPTLFNR